MAGHPKLGNSLSKSSIEEVGARTKVFDIDRAMGSMEKYIEWLFKQCLHDKIKVSDVITPEALLRLAQALITPLQIICCARSYVLLIHTSLILTHSPTV